MVDVTAQIILNEQIAPDHHVLGFRVPQIAASAQPGQFIHVRVGECIQPLLRVPLGVHDVTDDRRDVLAITAAVGPRTKALAHKRVGETVDVLGPMGVPFSLGEPADTVALVGGGVGLAPLVFLAKRLRGGDGRRRTVVVFAGLRTAEHLPLTRDLQTLCDELVITTDDGSHGKPGLVTDALGEFLADRSVDRIVACGPMAMLRAVAEIALRDDIPCEVSVERRMGCGVGVCLGCVVPVWVRSSDPPEWKYVRSCLEGPTFDARDIVWEEVRE